jgi:hypothetical protein
MRQLLNWTKNGMSLKRFIDICTTIRFLMQPETKLDDILSKKYRWMLVDGFIRNFNQYRASNFIPSVRFSLLTSPSPAGTRRKVASNMLNQQFTMALQWNHVVQSIIASQQSSCNDAHSRTTH